MKAPARVIHKFRLAWGLPTKIPRVVRTLHVGVQNDEIFLWAEVVPDDEGGVERPRIYSIAATGDRIKRTDAHHIGTVLIGKFVWHVYEVIA